MILDKWVRIKEGKHQDGLTLGIHFGKEYESYEVMFDQSCRYNLEGLDQLDWNKLFGWSYGLHTKNSIRVGWRYNKERDCIQVSLFVHKDGKIIHSEDGIDLQFNKKYTLELGVSKELYTTGLIVSRKDEVDRAVVSSYITPKLGYKLGVYFGGNKPAPKDLKIWMKKLN